MSKKDKGFILGCTMIVVMAMMYVKDGNKWAGLSLAILCIIAYIVSTVDNKSN